MSDYIPVNSGFGSDAIGAFGGALIGSWFGDGWGGNGWNRNGSNCNCGDGFSTNLLNDGINSIQSAINQVGRDVTSGICSLGYQTADIMGRSNVANLQGFNQISRDVSNNGSSIVSAINNLGSQMSSCCCATQRLVEQQGCQTRELMQAIANQAVRDQLCDAKSEISFLKSKDYATQLASSSVATILAKLPTTPATGA